MKNPNFYPQLENFVDAYIKQADAMLKILARLRLALLSFDTSSLNTSLDEKMVIDQELKTNNAQLASMLEQRYGSFSREGSQQLIDEFPEILSRWKTLQNFIKSVKKISNEIKYIINAIKDYNDTIMKEFQFSSPNYYRPGGG